MSYSTGLGILAIYIPRQIKENRLCWVIRAIVQFDWFLYQQAITSYPISSEKKTKMAERFAKVNEQEIRELLDNTTPKIP